MKPSFTIEAAGLPALRAFVEVAERRSFSAAARARGVSPSALSQSVRQLEAAVGTPLLARTTRSVNLTDAGAALRERVLPALRELDAALAEAAEPGRVRGTLRLTLGRSAVPAVVSRLLPELFAAHPDLGVELSVDDRFVDLVEAGFDAGVRLQETIDPDLIAVRLTPPFRFVIVGAPAYLARRGRPREPAELLAHDCIGWRLPSTDALFRWRLERDGATEEVAVAGRVVCDDVASHRALARAGLGLAFVDEPSCDDDLRAGALEVVLEAWAPRVPGYFVYFPRSAARQAKLRALAEACRRSLERARP